MNSDEKFEKATISKEKGVEFYKVNLSIECIFLKELNLRHISWL